MGVADRCWGSGAVAWDYDETATPTSTSPTTAPIGCTATTADSSSTSPRRPGSHDPGWSMGAAAADYDADGDLDLFVAHYFYFDLDDPPGNTGPGRRPRSASGKGPTWPAGRSASNPSRIACSATRATAASPTSARRAGIGDAEPGHGMGVSLDRPRPRRLARRLRGQRRLAQPRLPQPRRRRLRRDRAPGPASPSATPGVPLSGMGVAAGDSDGNGDEEIFVTNYSQPVELALPLGGLGMYEDYGALAGLVDVELPPPRLGQRPSSTSRATATST